MKSIKVKPGETFELMPTIDMSKFVNSEEFVSTKSLLDLNIL